MALLNPADLLPASSADARERFEERYLASQASLLAQPPGFVAEYGERGETASLTTKYPMAFLGLKYEETIAEGGRFKTIGEKECDLTVAQYDEGVEIEALKVVQDAWTARRWFDAAADLPRAEEVFVARLIAAALVANTATCGWDDLAIFHDSHLANPKDPDKGTFDNLQASAKDVVSLANIEAEITLMLEVLDLNGDALGVSPDTIFVPRAKWQGLRNLLKQDFVPNSAGTATMKNPYNETLLNVVRIDPLTDVNDWYLLDSALIKRGLHPWVVAKLTAYKDAPLFNALSMRWYLEDSDRFKDTGKIAMSSRVYYGHKFLYPHAIRKITGA